MPWMRMPGQTWTTAAASFLGMWLLMMAAMMLPSLVHMLWRYRQAIGVRSEVCAAWLTALVGAGYFSVWAVIGLAVFPVGVALTSLATRPPLLAGATPTAIGAIVLLAGLVQFTTWKTHHLLCARESPAVGRTLQSDAGTALRYGLRLGLHCIYSCSGLMAILLTFGMTNPRAMAVVTAAITAERLLPAGPRVAKSVGAAIVIAGCLLLAQAAGM
jgi:predicted metal-binding membrane protein